MTASLDWVVVAGDVRRVSEFSSLPRGRRPRAFCPECARAVTLKLGPIRQHHAAHAPHDHCIATNPETALHINLKFNIAAQLRAGLGARQPLVIRRRCVSCEDKHDDEWMHGWDDVAVEQRVGDARRPDVVLWRAGRPIAAIEVRVSHAVTDEKSAALAVLGVAWIEVRAEQAMVDTWVLEVPLAVARSSDAWRCPKHALRTQLRAARVVDVYHEAGRRDRSIYRLDEWRDAGSGRLVALSLRRDGREVATQPATGDAASKREAWAKLRLAFADDLTRLAASDGAFTDSPMRWAEGDVAANLVDEALSDVSPYDPTPLGTRYPRRWHFARERGEWFLPPDMRRVRWDRAAHDIFAAHPASIERRAVVRERPVPEYAWSGFVFAGRPIPASFGREIRVVMETPTIALVGTDRVLVVLSQPAPEDAVRALAFRLAAEGIAHLWLSHPADWSGTRADLAWAPAGRDQRGRGVVVIDGLGVYRAEQFLRAFARGTATLSPDRVRERLADRVAALPAR